MAHEAFRFRDESKTTHHKSVALKHSDLVDFSERTEKFAKVLLFHAFGKITDVQLGRHRCVRISRTKTTNKGLARTEQLHLFFLSTRFFAHVLVHGSIPEYSQRLRTISKYPKDKSNTGIHTLLRMRSWFTCAWTDTSLGVLLYYRLHPHNHGSSDQLKAGTYYTRSNHGFNLYLSSSHLGQNPSG